jgi:hypothetical protein
LIEILEKGRKFNANDDTAEMLESLSQWRSIEAAGNERKLLVHADNARPDIAKLSTQYFNENRMKSVPQPPLISRRRTFPSSGMSRDVSQASHSRMQISFLILFTRVRRIIHSIPAKWCIFQSASHKNV